MVFPYGISNVLREINSLTKISAVLISSVAFFVLFVLLIFPQYSWEMTMQGYEMFFEAFIQLLLFQYDTLGILGIVLPLTLSILVGITTVFTAGNLYHNYKSAGGWAGGFSSFLGILTAGCASCGVGVLSLFGYTTGMTFLPFEGIEIQILTIILLLGVLEYSGRNNSCALPKR